MTALAVILVLVGAVALAILFCRAARLKAREPGPEGIVSFDASKAEIGRTRRGWR